MATLSQGPQPQFRNLLADAIRDYTPTLANRLNDPTSGAGLAVDAVGGLADMLIGQPYRSMNNLLSRPYVSGDPQAAEDAFNVAGAAMVGGLAAPRPRNSLGTVGRPEPPSLPMDEASRMARAREMGFHPRPHYHGTAATFDQFDLTRGGQTSGARAGGLGVSVSPSADVANEFATLAANKSGGDPSVMPLMIRPGKPAAIQLTGAEKNLEVAATLDDAFKQGYDSVVLKNYTTPGGGQGNVVVVVRDPSQLRSTSAAFDPAQAHSPNLLAANGGRPGALAGASINALADNQPTGIRAYHGSPHDFDRFDMSKIGTGEGAQAYGHGLYFAEAENVAKTYKDAGPEASRQYDIINGKLTQLAREMDKYRGGTYGTYTDPKGYELKAEYDRLMEDRKKIGRMYEVNIRANPDDFLDWDKPLSQQPPSVQKLLTEHPRMGPAIKDWANRRDGEGQSVWHAADELTKDPIRAAEALRNAGIPGIRYLDQGSRGAGEGSRNYVVFDDNLIEILRKYGLVGLMAGGAAAGMAPPAPNQLGEALSRPDWTRNLRPGDI
jgi:hypothetical protein